MTGLMRRHVYVGGPRDGQDVEECYRGYLDVAYVEAKPVSVVDVAKPGAVLVPSHFPVVRHYRRRELMRCPETGRELQLYVHEDEGPVVMRLLEEALDRRRAEAADTPLMKGAKALAAACNSTDDPEEKLKMAQGAVAAAGRVARKYDKVFPELSALALADYLLDSAGVPWPSRGPSIEPGKN